MVARRDVIVARGLLLGYMCIVARGYVHDILLVSVLKIRGSSGYLSYSELLFKALSILVYMHILAKPHPYIFFTLQSDSVFESYLVAIW